ncbi:hypothetical protein ACROYT_G009962 [Oculina patagonica]
MISKLTMARSPIKVVSDNHVAPSADETLDFDDNNLRAIAEVYKNQGNEEYRKRDFTNAIHFYTEGIKVNCKDDKLKAQLYSNRAIANFKLGNFLDSLSDAKVATELQPIFLKAIVRGASACVELKQFEKAITWCDNGLAGYLLFPMTFLMISPMTTGSARQPRHRGSSAFKVDGRCLEDEVVRWSHYLSGAELVYFINVICPDSMKIDKNNKTLLGLKNQDEDTKSDTKTAQKNVVNESEVTSSVDIALEYDDDNLREKAEIFKNKGNYEYSKKNLSNAIHFYTEGIKVNCKDDELNAKLYSNRAISHLHLGNYENSLRDAKAATDLQPTFLKAIERGASACLKLNRFGEAITWCEKGLAVEFLNSKKIDKNNKKLLELRIRSVKEQNKQQKPDRDSKEKNSECHTVKGKVGDLKSPNAKRLGDRAEEALLCGNLGNAFFSLGDFRKAIDYYELHLKIAKEVGDKAGEGRAYGNLGNAFLSLGDFRKAKDYYELHLKIAKEVGDKAGEGSAYGNLGIALLSLGDFRKAIDYYELDLKIAKEVGDKAGEGRAYGNLGNAFLSLGDFRKAKDYYELRLKIAKEVGDKAGEGSAYGNLGIAFRNLGDFRKAIDYYELHLKIAKEVGDKAGEGRAYGNLGNALLSLGDFRKAIDYYELHLKIAKEVGDKAGEGRAYGNLGNALLSLGDFRKAIDYYELHLKIAKEVGDKAGEGSAYGNLGIAFRNLGDFRKAIDYYELHLKIAKEVGDKAGEGSAYGNLGNAFFNLGDFRKAIDYYELRLKIAKEVEDKAGEGRAYGNLGNALLSLGDFRKAIDYYELHLKIAKEVGDKAGEGSAYGNLGIAFRNLGDFRKAIDYYELHLKIAKEVGDKAGEGSAYGNLGNAFFNLGDFRKAIDYYELRLKIAKEVEDKAGEGRAYGNLGNAFLSLGDFRKAIDYYELDLKIAKEVGDKAGEGSAYGNLGNAFGNLGDFRKAIDYNELQLKITKEVGNKAEEAISYHNLGLSFESQGFLSKALEYYDRGVRLFNNVRSLLQSNDEWKIGYRNEVDNAYTGLWRVMLKQGKAVEALLAAEKGRAQAVSDLMLSQFGIRKSQSVSQEEDEEQYLQLIRSIQSSTVFQALGSAKIHLWVLSKEGPVRVKAKEIGEAQSVLNDATAFFQSLIKNAIRQIRFCYEVRCENRSLDALRENRQKADDNSDGENSQPFDLQEISLSTLYNILFQPIADLVQGDELIIVPHGPLWLAPYAALMDADSKYLCELFRIRLIPSLTSLELIAECPDDYHSRSGALLVGDPWVEEVTNSKGEKFLDPLPFARKEVEMIGKILNVTPLIGKKATKREVLKGLSSVALVHIAAHGRMETGEIALTPDSKQASRIPTKEEDYILNMSDVLSVKVRARLVVLSCCHSGRGEIKAEGVVGIARAFMGAGARSVLVSLWAIDDEATLGFMKSFYHHLVEGRSASVSLNKAIKDFRESDKYSDVKYWAPFVLIGDDVTLEFHQKK